MSSSSTSTTAPSGSLGAMSPSQADDLILHYGELEHDDLATVFCSDDGDSDAETVREEAEPADFESELNPPRPFLPPFFFPPPAFPLAHWADADGQLAVWRPIQWAQPQPPLPIAPEPQRHGRARAEPAAAAGPLAADDAQLEAHSAEERLEQLQ